MDVSDNSDGTTRRHYPGAGYWIAPTGQVVRVASRHILDVCQRPDAFGVSRQELEALFDAYGEAWGAEQRAREQTIRILVAHGGWIRVRQYLRRPTFWAFNLPALSPSYKAIVGAFFRLLGASLGKEEQVCLDAPEGRSWLMVQDFVKLDPDAATSLVWAPDKDALPVAAVRVRLEPE